MCSPVRMCTFGCNSLYLFAFARRKHTSAETNRTYFASPQTNIIKTTFQRVLAPPQIQAVRRVGRCMHSQILTTAAVPERAHEGDGSRGGYVTHSFMIAKQWFRRI